MYVYKVRDVESYTSRLRAFLSDRCLLFNPYQVPDEQLIEVAGRLKWRGCFSLTQMVILEFLRVETVKVGSRDVELVYYKVGYEPEVKEWITSFICSHTAADSLQPVRHTINGRRITQAKQIYALMGKRVFVSRSIVTCTNRGYGKAMSMHRLTTDVAINAAIVREAMINARIEMLERLRKYPHSSVYLDGTPAQPVDITNDISAVINLNNGYRTAYESSHQC